jgi:hypothetical protein
MPGFIEETVVWANSIVRRNFRLQLSCRTIPRTCHTLHQSYSLGLDPLELLRHNPLPWVSFVPMFERVFGALPLVFIVLLYSGVVFRTHSEWDDYRRGEQREPIFSKVSLNLEKKSAVYCYEYHKELLHNPVLTADDISGSIAEK